MKRTVIYTGEEFKDIDFENITEEELEAKEFTKGIGRLYDNSTFNVNERIEECKKICKVCNSNLVVIYKYEYENEIATRFFHRL